MKKHLKSKIVVALVAVTVLTCCFVGSTFAKYTSTKESSATVTVASWDITGVTDTETHNFTFDTNNSVLSPATTGVDSTNTVTSGSLVITNNSAVSATLTFDVENSEVNYKVAEPTDSTLVGKISNTFSSTLTGVVSSGNTGTFNKSTKATTNYASTYTVTLEPEKSVTVTFTLTWKTVDDATDTYLGINAEGVSTTVRVTAVQASVLPASGS